MRYLSTLFQQLNYLYFLYDLESDTKIKSLIPFAKQLISTEYLLSKKQ
ncbi:hypothetical protein UNH65_18815 [Chitinophaga sp. 180180018-2]|nr:hypothetical protein [Chitinophaga sp. 212800010-3]